MGTKKTVATKRIAGLGHEVFVNGQSVGVVTSYKGSWWLIEPTRECLGVGTLADAAEIAATR